MQSILQQASLMGNQKVALGLDSQQLAGIPTSQKAAAGHALRPGEVVGKGPGYFKLSRGWEGQIVSANGTQGDTFLMPRLSREDSPSDCSACQSPVSLSSFELEATAKMLRYWNFS